MLLCGIINELNRLITKSELLSYFFCQATDSRINSATAVLRGLIYMLVDQHPSLVSHVRKKYDQAGKTLFEDSNAWVALLEILTNILQDPSLTSAYLVIDALDECVADLPKLLAFIIQKLPVYPYVKWLVSSRNWPPIEEQLNKAGHKATLCLELNTESVSSAVNSFIRHKVHQLAEEKNYKDKTQDAILDYLFSNANGTFLWVALVCENLKNITRGRTLLRLNSFLPGLDPLYERMMTQICYSEDSELCIQILAAVATVFRPITLSELMLLVMALQDMSDDIESLQEIIRLCGSFLTVRNSTIYFIYQSAKDYLLAKASNYIFLSGKEDIYFKICISSFKAMSSKLTRSNIWGL
jgi:hypothetical protein